MLKKSTLASSDGGLFGLILSPWFIGGLGFYGINVILFAKALTHLDVSVAYPVLAGLGFALLAVASRLLLGEQLTPLRILGIALILGGIYMVARPC